ncbi:hypothetical protein ANCCEY_06653 [Ancylostoma ceylanicum]|uniref:Uncharacterized protein n=1 Tax=Ancylostoma ceylanicum TaxID=53326 RepID=A0A0D6LQG4_9BILA|nr:hypothetical protein ANCCEY_06653 [Ancylostoma ceylanicum]
MDGQGNVRQGWEKEKRVRRLSPWQHANAGNATGRLIPNCSAVSIAMNAQLVAWQRLCTAVRTIMPAGVVALLVMETSMTDGNADWVAQNLHRQRKILEEKQRQKRTASATIRCNQVPTAGFNSMDPSCGENEEPPMKDLSEKMEKAELSACVASDEEELVAMTKDCPCRDVIARMVEIGTKNSSIPPKFGVPLGTVQKVSKR